MRTATRLSRYVVGPRNSSWDFEPGARDFATQDAAIEWARRESKRVPLHHYVVDTYARPVREVGWGTEGRFVWLNERAA